MATLISSGRFCSSVTKTANPDSSRQMPGTTTAETVEQLEQLLEECMMLLDDALPIGTLFKSLSIESRNYIAKNKMSFEAFLIRYPQKFSVFKNRGDRNIYVSKAGFAPSAARHAQEVAGSTIGHGAVTDRRRAKVYTVLKYIPNEWASYVALPIPEDVKKRIIRKPAKNWFVNNPRYFEVRFNPRMGHTFEVRRSAQLQEFMKQKAQISDSERVEQKREAEAGAGGDDGEDTIEDIGSGDIVAAAAARAQGDSGDLWTESAAVGRGGGVAGGGAAAAASTPPQMRSQSTSAAFSAGGGGFARAGGNPGNSGGGDVWAEAVAATKPQQ